MSGMQSALAVLAMTALPAAQDGEPAAEDLGSQAAAAAGIDKALAYFVQGQHADGSWGTSNRASQFDGFFNYSAFYGVQFATHSLITMALLQAPETQPRRAALDKALRWLLASPVPLRSGRDKPIWGWLYGLEVMTLAIKDARFQGEDWLGPVATRGRELATWLQKNQEPAGGVGYYDYEPYQRGSTRVVESCTSFTTAAMLPGIEAARELGWVPAEFVQRARAYVQRCRLPNGAYQYHFTPVPGYNGGEHIDDVKGSLGRIQVCHFALNQAGESELAAETVRKGVEQFFEHHMFLDAARMRPVPHEAYYLNAGYFYFFGHYYCSLTINLLPAAEREAFHSRMRQHILKAQRPDGTLCDFLGTPPLIDASTAFAAMALMNGLPGG